MPVAAAAPDAITHSNLYAGVADWRRVLRGPRHGEMHDRNLIDFSLTVEARPCFSKLNLSITDVSTILLCNMPTLLGAIGGAEDEEIWLIYSSCFNLCRFKQVCVRCKRLVLHTRCPASTTTRYSVYQLSPTSTVHYCLDNGSLRCILICVSTLCVHAQVARPPLVLADQRNAVHLLSISCMKV